MRRFWICLFMLWGCAGCSSLHPALWLGSAKEPPAPSESFTLDRRDWSHVHPLEEPRPFLKQAGLAIPQAVKDHTYLFFINGLDPYYLANFRGQCQYMKALGYSNAYCGQMNHTELFRQKIIQLRKDDPVAQVVVVGYSTGANHARMLANQLNDDRLRIDLLVYLGGDTIKDADRSRPANAGRILNITGHGMILLGGDLLFRGDDIRGASNHRLDARHFMLPTRAEATELLVEAVIALNRVPPIGNSDTMVVPAAAAHR